LQPVSICCSGGPDMTSPGYLVATLFLPLFPFSMLFNRLLARLGRPWLRIGLLLLWPQLGILVLASQGERPPTWLAWWAVGTAALYALRTLPLRDLGLWTGYMATSAWTLLWPAAVFGTWTPDGAALAYQALGLSLPLVLLAWLAGRLEADLGAAYAGLCSGLAQTLPKLSGLLVLSVLAAVATPLVPGFFTLLATTVEALSKSPGIALLILTVWLLWAWSGARILREFIVGPVCADSGRNLGRDLGTTAAGLLGLTILVLLLAGISLSGEMT
jgi:NADH:ubiquinone oxidoreductase subunit 4 (subunit M)